MQKKLKYAVAALILLGAGCSGGNTEETTDPSDTSESSNSAEVSVEIVDPDQPTAETVQDEATEETTEQVTEPAPKASADEGASAETQNQNGSSNTTAAPVSDEGALRIINMTARKWEFDPEVVRVNQGDTVRLIIESTDVTHGIFIKAFNVNEVLSPGKATTIEFTASSKGTFPLVCSVPCGSGHGSMTGSLIVE